MDASDRLRQAIAEKGFDGPSDAWAKNKRALGISKDLVISNANGNRAISKKAAATYAKVFGKTPGWYLYGEREQSSEDVAAAPKTPAPTSSLPVPILTQVSAGKLQPAETVTPRDIQGHIIISGLGRGNWAALIVNGTSMNKVAPDGSIIVFNRSDTRPVTDGFFVFQIPETGEATFKRWGGGKPAWLRPYSYDDHDPILAPEDLVVLGRVKKVVVDL